ncbi:MAG: PQQ-dependent sugar dehydrogenase, partial [Solirubrobacterales bacterium]
MKRLLTITVLALITLTTGVASAATLKPLAGEGAWNSPPIFATAPPDDPRVFVVERGDPGTSTADIRIFEDGALKPTPFLSLDNVDLDGERGLLSMAFPRDYATTGHFYVFWVADGDDAIDPAGAKGDIRIVEFSRSGSDPDIADPDSGRLVLKTAHSATNHNGGWMGFGPDDLLYFTIGDNASSANAQDLANLFGKVLRIDPSGDAPGEYTNPSGNPFGGPFDPFPGAREEVFISGLRNPYRASFSSAGLTIGDVGAGQTEEVDVLPTDIAAGKNLGWPNCEGFCDEPNPAFFEPFFTYEHDNNNANPAPLTGNVIIGGYVVRDPDLNGLTGRYLYGDNNRADLRTLNLSVPGGDPVDPGLSVDQFSLLSFGEDGRGCTYVMAGGTVFRIAANAASTT